MLRGMNRNKVALVELLALLVGLILLACTLSPEVVSDGEMRFAAVAAMLNEQPVPPIKYSLIQPALSLPLAAGALAFGIDPKTAVGYFNLVVFVLLGGIILLELSRRFGASVACKAMLVLMSMSMLPHHLQQYFGEVLSALLITAGVLLAPRAAVASALLLGLGVANTPVLLVPAAVGAAILVRRLPALSVGVAVAVTIFALENVIKFGSLRGSAYFSAAEAGFATVLPYSGRPGFAYPLFFGVLSILFSFGKGLVFFIPALLLFFRKDTYRLLNLSGVKRWALWAAAAALVLVYSKWWAWYGGNFWGPRFFLILAVPAALALAVHLQTAARPWHAAFLAALVLLSTWVGIDGVIFGQKGMDICMANNYQLEFLCWYVPEFSALWRPFVILRTKAFIAELFGSARAPFALWQLAVGAYLVGTVASAAWAAGSKASGDAVRNIAEQAGGR